MKNQNAGEANDPCILIESSKWGDAGFYGKWLLAAAHAETLWKEARIDPEFEKRVQRVCVAYIPDFGIGASAMLRQLLKRYRTTLVLDLDSEDAEDFAMMVTMGLFAFQNGRYRMRIPSDLSLAKVKEAILRYAGTEDEECALHPEHVVNTMSFLEGRALQKCRWSTGGRRNL
jgi:hypothetical protein